MWGHTGGMISSRMGGRSVGHGVNSVFSASLQASFWRVRTFFLRFHSLGLSLRIRGS